MENNLFLVSKLDNQPHKYFFKYFKSKDLKFEIILVPTLIYENNSSFSSEYTFFYRNKKFIKKYFFRIIKNDYLKQFFSILTIFIFTKNILKKIYKKKPILISDNLILTSIGLILKNFNLVKKVIFLNHS